MTSPQKPGRRKQDCNCATEIDRLRLRLDTLIVWMAQSANSPISVRDAERLLNEIGNA